MRQARFWASAPGMNAPGLVYHRICDDKSAATFTALMKGCHAWVVCDALGTHDAGARACPGLRLVTCSAHVLRRFRETVADFPDAQVMLAWIGDLYRIDEPPRRLRGLTTLGRNRRRDGIRLSRVLSASLFSPRGSGGAGHGEGAS